MPATITRPTVGIADARVARRPRLEAPDLELLLDALGDLERNVDERPRLRRIRDALELELADRLAE